MSRPRPDYLEWDPGKMTGTMLTTPEAEDVPFEVNLQLSVEFYSQR